jgi:protein-disulfide isomerase-like protein with CxxC motif
MLTALERAVLNTGRKTYPGIQAALYDQGVDVSETAVRKVIRKLGLSPRSNDGKV